MKFVYLAMLVAATSSCAARNAMLPMPDPLFLQITESPSRFDGKNITVRAWISLRHEDKNLWATWRDHEEWETTRCISLVNYDALDSALDGHLVEVTGVVRKDASNGGRLLRLASCSNVAIEVSGPESLRSVAK